MLTVGSSTVNAAEDPNDALAGVLPNLSSESRRKLEAILSAPGFSGQIPGAAVKDLLRSEHKSIAELMLALLPLARMFSHPPISNYHVGVVAHGVSGNLYLGFNLEFPGQALGFAVHGEQAALSSAYMHSEQEVSSIALTAAPCGHCRQFMKEMAPDGQMEIVVPGAAPVKLAALLPQAFGPSDLGRKEGAFPVKETKLTRATATPDELLQAAFEAARYSYAPYSGAYSGVAIGTRSGRIYKGSYIENVAFNPSLSPLQTALVQLIVAGEEYGAIARVALVEVSGAKISQRSATEAVLSAVAPKVRVEMANASAG
jgi:cytidine deaminase